MPGLHNLHIHQPHGANVPLSAHTEQQMQPPRQSVLACLIEAGALLSPLPPMCLFPAAPPTLCPVKHCLGEVTLGEGVTCISRQDAHGNPIWDAQSTLRALRCYSGINTSLIAFNSGNLSFLNVFSQQNSSLGFFRFCYFLTKSPRNQNLQDAILAHVSKSFAPQQGWESRAGGGGRAWGGGEVVGEGRGWLPKG